MTVDVSVAICTHDRPRRLRALLETACALAVPPGLAWELLVIDNGANPATEAAAGAFAGRLPLRLVREPAEGLCHARNRAVAEARGRYVCWADDDTLLDPAWLAAYAAAFARHPGAALFGGRILPFLESPVSPWFARRLHEWPVNYVVAHRDMGDFESEVGVEGGRLPWGANCAALAEAQRRHPYNIELGLSPHHRRTGEETDVAYRILKAGGTGWWVPGAKVRHVIPAERQSRAEILRHYDVAGRTAAFLHDRFPGDNSLAVFGPLRFARFGPVGLGLASAAAGLVSAAAGLAGATGPSIRFLARRGYYRGIAAHQSERRTLDRQPPARLSEAGGTCS